MVSGVCWGVKRRDTHKECLLGKCGGAWGCGEGGIGVEARGAGLGLARFESLLLKTQGAFRSPPRRMHTAHRKPLCTRYCWDHHIALASCFWIRVSVDDIAGGLINGRFLMVGRRRILLCLDCIEIWVSCFL